MASFMCRGKTEWLRNHSGRPFQMVNLVITQRLGKWQRAQGFLKKKKKNRLLHCAWLRFWWNCLSLLCYAMCSAAHSVARAHEAYSKFVFMGVVGWLIRPKNQSERQTLKREREKTERDRKRDKERDRGGQLPQMQFAHISLVPAFSPADVHHLLNYTSATNLGRI